MNTQELRGKIKQLKPLPNSAKKFSWLSHRIELREKILNDNPEEFLTWPVVRATMFIGSGAKQIAPELEWLLKNANWKDAIQENKFGKPEILENINTSGNLVNQVFYLNQWCYHNSYYIDSLSDIVEFGGGYGAMALICRRLGFTGTYTIIDLPEFLLLQEYYLSNVLDDISNIHFINSFDDYEIDAELMIAICSLSEVDNATKDRFFDQVSFKHNLVVYQPDWNNWNNEAYFSGKLHGVAQGNPYFTNHRYVVG